MQLDRVPPPAFASGPADPPVGSAFSGTSTGPFGVSSFDRSGGNGGTASPQRRLRTRHYALVGLAVFALLGQGERCRVDPRFDSPSATLATYWSALRDGDAGTVRDCLTYADDSQPFPGMLWFMPPTREVRLESFRSLPVESGRLLVTYQVRFRPLGAQQEQRFQTGNELVRRRGEWRIARGLGPAGLPSWRPIPRSVDS
jgi:hypothetical protein